MRSWIIQAVQACPSLKGDSVLGDSLYFVLVFFKVKQEGPRSVEVLHTLGVAVLQGGQEVSVFEIGNLGFILLTWWCLYCVVGNDSQKD